MARRPVVRWPLNVVPFFRPRVEHSEAQLISLGIFILLTGLSVLVAAWALSVSARAVGSPRGRFRVGLGVSIVLVVVSIVFAVAGAALTPTSPVAVLAAGLALLAAQLGVAFALLRSVFRLSVARTFAPFGAHVGVAVAQLAFALFIIKPFVVEAFVLSARSMSPTIEPGDRILVNKLLRPKRLDLVAYWTGGARPTIYCKRLIGLPGETLRFDRGGIFVNDRPVALPAVIAGRCHASPSGVPANLVRYRDGESIVLGDEYFVIGDNVDLSADSRLEGPSPASSFVGVVDFRYWPLTKARPMR